MEEPLRREGGLPRTDKLVQNHAKAYLYVTCTQFYIQPNENAQMNGRTLVFVAIFSVPWHVTLAGESGSGPAIARQLVDNVYQPLHSKFADASAQWATDVVDLCQRQPASSTYKMQVQFTHLVEAYAAVALFRVGPLMENNLPNRLFYWPDKRRVAERQLRTLLAEIDDQRITAQQLAGKSVAVQGFTALERLLFTASSLPIEIAPQCHLIPIVIENIADMANQLDAGWQSNSTFVQSLLAPQAGSPYFRTPEEVARSVFTQIKVGLDIVLDGKLKPLLSNDINTMRQTPLWNSQRTVAMLTGNLRGLRALLLESGLLDGTRFDDELRVEFDYIDQVLLELEPIVYFLGPEGSLDPRVRVLMHKLAAVVAGVRYTLNIDVSEALGMSASFNSADGD